MRASLYLLLGPSLMLLACSSSPGNLPSDAGDLPDVGETTNDATPPPPMDASADASDAAAPATHILGMNGGGENDAGADDLVNLHVHSDRAESGYSGGASGTFADPNYRGTWPQYVARLASRQLMPLVLFNSYAPQATFDDASFRQGFADGVVAWAKLYAPGGSFWSARTDGAYAPRVLEILNEPSGDWYRGGVVNPASYGDLVKRVRSSLDAAGIGSDRVSVLAEARCDGNANAWDDGVNSTGAYAAADALDIHSYGDVLVPLDGTSWTGFDGVFRCQATYKPNGVVYVTEIGFCLQGGAGDCVGGSYTESQKEAEIRGLIDLLAKTSWLAGVWYFNLHPYGGNTFGLYDSTGKQTGAYIAFRDEAMKNGF